MVNQNNIPMALAVAAYLLGIVLLGIVVSRNDRNTIRDRLALVIVFPVLLLECIVDGLYATMDGFARSLRCELKKWTKQWREA